MVRWSSSRHSAKLTLGTPCSAWTSTTATSATPQPQPPTAIPAPTAGVDTPSWIRRPAVNVVFPLGCLAPASSSLIGATPPRKKFRNLGDLPSKSWDFVEPPPPGYHYRAIVEIGGHFHEVLLDGGAAFSLITEEHLVEILNKAVELGLNEFSDNWPLAGLQQWGAVSQAATVAKGESLQIGAIALLRIVLVSGERRWPHIIRARVALEGSGGFHMLIIGAPDLDQPPLGLGHKPTVGGHYFSGPDMILPRVEADEVQRGIQGQLVASLGPLRPETRDPMSFCVTLPLPS